MEDVIIASVIALSKNVIVYIDTAKRGRFGYDTIQKQLISCGGIYCSECKQRFRCEPLREVEGFCDKIIPCVNTNNAVTTASNICNAINTYNKAISSDIKYITPIIISSGYAETHDKLAFNVVRIRDCVFIHNYDIKDSDRGNKQVGYNGFTLSSVNCLDADTTHSLFVRGVGKSSDDDITVIRITKEKQIMNYIKQLKGATLAWNETTTDYVNVVDVIV